MVFGGEREVASGSGVGRRTPSAPGSKGLTLPHPTPQRRFVYIGSPRTCPPPPPPDWLPLSLGAPQQSPGVWGGVGSRPINRLRKGAGGASGGPWSPSSWTGFAARCPEAPGVQETAGDPAHRLSGKRDFVDHLDRVDPVDGVVLVTLST
ncbi:unnamed protein product [Lepidochelys kempii]